MSIFNCKGFDCNGCVHCCGRDLVVPLPHDKEEYKPKKEKKQDKQRKENSRASYQLLLNLYDLNE